MFYFFTGLAFVYPLPLLSFEQSDWFYPFSTYTILPLHVIQIKHVPSLRGPIATNYERVIMPYTSAQI